MSQTLVQNQTIELTPQLLDYLETLLAVVYCDFYSFVGSDQEGNILDAHYAWAEILESSGRLVDKIDV